MAIRFPDPIHPVDPVELEINQQFNRLIACLQQRRMSLLATYRDTREQIAARHTARDRKEQELIALKTETERLLQMNELRETQQQLLVVIEQKLAEVRVPQPETRVVFRGNCGHLEQLIAGVGELVEEEVSVGPRYEDMRPIVAVGKKGTAPGELWVPRGVAVDENTNLIYVAEWLPRVSIFSETGEFINTFTHEDMRQPWGIAIHRDSLYLTDIRAHAVFHFKMETDMRLVAKLGSEGFGVGQFNEPLGLTVSTNGDVFVADSRNNRIQILDDTLHFKSLITHQTMEYPRDIKLTPDEVYVLCYGFILVLTYTADAIRSFNIHPLNRFDIAPSVFCLDAHRNIITGDCGNRNIRVISKEGTFLYTIGNTELIWGLTGIALTKNLKIVAVYNGLFPGSNQLIVFSS